MQRITNRVNVECKNCGTSMSVPPSRIAQGRGRFCSKNCQAIAQKAIKGPLHHRWVGDKVTYGPLHTWVERELGKPSLCGHCETTKDTRYEWANISGEYRRDLKDWVRLCKSCHLSFDNVLNKSWVTRHAISNIG